MTHHTLTDPVDIGGVEYVPLCCAKAARQEALHEALDAVAAVAIRNSWPEEPVVAALTAIEALWGES